MFRNIRRPVLALAIAGLATIGSMRFVGSYSRADDKPSIGTQVDGRRATGTFRGAKANTGYAIETRENGRIKLAVSEDFEIPNTPAPSWQIVDSQGNTYLLNQFRVKNGTNRAITLPTYIHDVKKVQVWCSFAEVLLGEAEFKS